MAPPQPWAPQEATQTGRGSKTSGQGVKEDDHSADSAQVAARFAVRFHQEGDAVEIKASSWNTVPSFSAHSLPAVEQEEEAGDTGKEDAGDNAGENGASASAASSWAGEERNVYVLEGGMPYYAGVSPATASTDPCCYSIHQGAIGGKLIAHLHPVLVTKVDDVPSHMSWTAIIKNTAVEDDPVLSVIPYFGDDDREGVDLSLYQKNATVEEEHDPVCDELILLCGDKYGMSQAANMALARTLQRNGSYISERYASLCTERDELRAKAEREAGAVASKASSSQKDAAALECRGLETYTAMFCRRCFKYDCDFHGIYHPQCSMKDCPPGRPPERKAAAKRAKEAAAAAAPAEASTEGDKKEDEDDEKTEAGKTDVKDSKVVMKEEKERKTDLYSAVGAAATAAAAAAAAAACAAAGALRCSTSKAGDVADGWGGRDKGDKAEGGGKDDGGSGKSGSGGSAQGLATGEAQKKQERKDGGAEEDTGTDLPMAAQVLHHAMKALGSEAATRVADKAKPPWTAAERQLANKGNCILNGQVQAIARLIPTRTVEQVAAYVAELPNPSGPRGRSAAVLEPLKEGSATPGTGPGGQTSYTRPFGSRGSSKHKKQKQKLESTQHTLSILRKQEKLGVKHEYRPCTCALSGRRCDETCECVKSNNFCEKFCACAGALGGCSNGFPGCGCRKTECRAVGCPCWDAFRECDADVCTCSASGMLEEFNTSFEMNVLDDKSRVWGSELDNLPSACWRHRYDRHLPPRLFTKREQETTAYAPAASHVHNVASAAAPGGASGGAGAGAGPSGAVATSSLAGAAVGRHKANDKGESSKDKADPKAPDHASKAPSHPAEPPAARRVYRPLDAMRAMRAMRAMHAIRALRALQTRRAARRLGHGV